MAYNSNNFEDCTIVYFSLESTGGSTDSDILQIAACEENENFTFSEYVEPRQSIHHKVSSVNGEFCLSYLFQHNRAKIIKVKFFNLQDSYILMANYTIKAKRYPRFT